jgi:hypothetical protein
MFIASETIGSSNGWIQSRVITLPDTVLFLRGLEEGTDYKVIGVALEGTTGLYSTSGPFQVRTESETSSPKINPGMQRFPILA